MVQRISLSAAVLVLAALPLVRLSLEGVQLTRHTWSWLGLFICTLFVLYILNLKRVHRKYHLGILLLLAIPFVSAALQIHRANIFGIMYAELALLIALAWYFLLTKTRAMYAALTLICIASLFAQWGIAQYALQHDLGLSFIGESILNTNTAGVATYYSNGEKFIRAYGPFAHANSLGGILALALVVIAFTKKLYKNMPLMFILPILATLELGLIVTFSRSALLSGIMALVYLAILHNKKALASLGIILAISTPLILVRTTDTHDVAAHDRLEGLHWAYNMTTPASLIRGYGLGNYESTLTQYLAAHSIAHNPWDIAPVHSTLILMLMETGIIITVGSIVLIFFVIKKYNLWAFLILLPPLLIDHYFLTQIGPLMWLTVSTIIAARVY